MLISKELFGMENNQKVYEYTLKNANGVEISCLNYGCTITKMITPDRRGEFENIVLGFQDFANYKDNSMYAGAVVGRVAGRIKNAQFQLAGKTYTLASNNGPNHLHGGLKGFHNVIWDVEIIAEEEEAILEFYYTSIDGEGGYPGTLSMKIRYTLNNNNEFSIFYQGQSDDMTLLNPTNHTYFNLSGNLQRDISQHVLTIDSSNFLELTDQLLPTGRIVEVQDTVFDFRRGRKIHEGLHAPDAQIIIAGKGYDHGYILDSNLNGEMVLWDEESGRSLLIETDTVGVVLYTGNQIPDNLDMWGVQSRPYLGICLETQGLPDSIHHSNFPSCILNKDQIFSSMTKYTFGIQQAT